MKFVWSSTEVANRKSSHAKLGLLWQLKGKISKLFFSETFDLILEWFCTNGFWMTLNINCETYCKPWKNMAVREHTFLAKCSIGYYQIMLSDTAIAHFSDDSPRATWSTCLLKLMKRETRLLLRSLASLWLGT